MALNGNPIPSSIDVTYTRCYKTEAPKSRRTVATNQEQKGSPSMEKDVLDSMPTAQRTSYELSRRKALGMVTKLGLGGAAAAAFGAGMGSRSVREAMAQAGLPQKDYKFTFVNHVTTNPFFTPTQYGAEDACTFFGTSYQWTGSQTAVVAEMVSAMQTAIADKVDGIAVCLVDAEAFNQPTDDALSVGIPVIGYNADTPNARLAYVGQSLYQSGYNIAQKWLPMVKPGGKVMLSIDTPGALNLQPRLDGYIQAIKDAGDPVTYDTLDTTTDQATGWTPASKPTISPTRTWWACSAPAQPIRWRAARSPRSMVWRRMESSQQGMTCSRRPLRSSRAAT